jgi:UDP-N-acetylmuramoyl-tripeptide--D-alanyl-D-alanine ligase
MIPTPQQWLRYILVEQSNLAQGCEIRATEIEIREGRPHFDLVTPAGRDAVGMRLVGEHHIANALAVAAVGTALELPIELIASSLSTAENSSKWRMEIHDLFGLLLINDAYNANPESMSAALRSLVLFRAGTRRPIMGIPRKNA